MYVLCHKIIMTSYSYLNFKYIQKVDNIMKYILIEIYKSYGRSPHKPPLLESFVLILKVWSIYHLRIIRGAYFIFFLKHFLMLIYLFFERGRERESVCVCVHEWERGRERGTDDPKWAPSWQQRVWCGAWTQEPRDHVAPGWLSWWSIQLWLRSWSHRFRVGAPHGVLCC